MREPRAWGLRELEMHARWRLQASNATPRRADRMAATPATEPLWCEVHGFGQLAGSDRWRRTFVAVAGAACSHRRGCPRT